MPTPMVSHQGQVIQVPDDQVQDLFLRRQAAFPGGAKIPVVSPDGEPGTIDAKEAHQAFKAGYTFDPGTVKEADLQERRGGLGQQVLAGIEGLASGATFGASRMVERGLGVDPTAMKERIAANPITSIGGEVAGAVIPSVISEYVTGGAATPAVAANVARIAALAPTLARTGGALVGREVESLVGKGLLSSIASASTEGAAYGLGNFVSEAALHTKGDPELTAEHALASVGMGAVLGGGVEAGTKLLGKGLSTLTPKSFPKGIGPNELEDFSAERLTKAVAGGKLKYTKQVDKWHGGPVEFGHALEDLGLGKVGVSPEGNLDIAKKAMDTFGPQLSQTYKGLDDLVNQNPKLAALLPESKPFFSNLKRNFVNAMKGQPSQDQVRNKLGDLLPRWQEEFGRGKRMSFADLWNLQKDMGDIVNWADTAQKPFNKSVTRLRGIIKGIISDNAEQTTKMAGQPNGAEAIAELNRKFSTAATAADILKDKIASSEANRTFSLTDHIVGAGTGLAGIAHGNPLGALASIPGAIANKLMRSQGNQVLAATATGLASMQRKLQVNAQRIATGVKDFMDRSGQGIIPSLERGFFANNSNPQEAYDERMEELNKAIGNPQRLVENLERSSSALSEVAPDTSKLMQQKAVQAAQFLMEKAPKNPGGGSSLFEGEWKPADSQIATWSRYWEAANDPLSVVDSLASGTVSKEGVEVLRTLYPKLYQEVQTEITQSLIQAHQDGGAQLSYGQRLQLSALFGMPIEKTLTPQFVAFAQSQFMQTGGQQQPQQGGIKTGKAEQLKMANSRQSGSEAIERRRASAS